MEGVSDLVGDVQVTVKAVAEQVLAAAVRTAAEHCVVGLDQLPVTKSHSLHLKNDLCAGRGSPRTQRGDTQKHKESPHSH